MPIQAPIPRTARHAVRTLLRGAVAMLLISSQSFADIYSWKDAEGNTVYSDTKGSSEAKRATPSNNANYYKPDKQNTAAAEDSVELGQPLAEDSLPELEVLGRELQKLTAAGCDADNVELCKQSNDWVREALERCGDDPRCQDSEFLDRKYRPRSAEEIMNIARKAGARNNRQDKEIALFLKKKYSNYCENQSAILCKNKPGNSCEKSMQNYCEEKGDLKDLFAKYDNLTDLQKKQIIDQAKAMAKARGDNQLSYKELISSLVDILMTQAVLGL